MTGANSGSEMPQQQVGVMAQELKTILPDAVRETVSTLCLCTILKNLPIIKCMKTASILKPCKTGWMPTLDDYSLFIKLCILYMIEYK